MESLPSDPSFLHNVRLQGTPKSALTDGETLTLDVVAFRRGRVQLSNGRIQLSARNVAGLSIGDTAATRVRIHNGVIRLQVLERAGGAVSHPVENGTLLSRFLQTARGLAPKSVLETVFHALIASHRPLVPPKDPQFYLRSKGGERKATRAALELSDRRIDLLGEDSTEVEELTHWFSGGGFQSQNRSSDNRSRRQGSNDNSQERTLSETLRTFLLRTTETPHHPLQLYNALKPQTGDLHWVVFPIRLIEENETTEAVLKIAFNCKQNRASRAVLSVEREKGRWWFEWCIEGGSFLERSGSEGDIPNPPEVLLAILGGTRHTMEMVEGDGFTLDYPVNGYKGVDRYG